jgi:hypothetical protein
VPIVILKLNFYNSTINHIKHQSGGTLSIISVGYPDEQREAVYIFNKARMHYDRW